MPSPLSDTFGFAALTIFSYMSGCFLAALAAKRNDIADVAWGLGFVVTAGFNLVRTGDYSPPSILVTALVTVWGLRLSWHIGRRNRNKPEDYRYKAWRDSWGKWFLVRSYLQVFMLQGLFMLLIISPVLIIHTYPPTDVTALAIIGTLLWVFGFLFESIGDKQLKDFLAKPENKGHVMDRGLWRYTRHPNYFGEVTQWWAIGIIALGSQYGWLGLAGPAVITFLIVKVSGVPLLENKYAGNPEYQAYKKRTSMLLPLPAKLRWMR